MKKITFLVCAMASVALVSGCQKKEAEAPVEPMVSEQVVAQPTAGTAMEPIAGQVQSTVAAVPGVVDSAAATGTQMMGQAATDIAAVIEKPTAEQIQQALKNAGLYDGKVDGDIGPKTKRAIEEFQKENGLNPDGKVGAKTWSKLGTHLAGSSISTEPVMPADASATSTTTSTY